MKELMKILCVDKLIRWDYTTEEMKWLKIQLWMLAALVVACTIL